MKRIIYLNIKILIMKTLSSNTKKLRCIFYTLLLTCFFCDLKAQDLEILTFNSKPILTVNADSSKVMCGGAELITIKLILEYELECYNDSTISYYWTFSDMGDTWKAFADKGDKNLMGQEVPMRVHHKEPTFSEFVRWLRKKYGL